MVSTGRTPIGMRDGAKYGQLANRFYLVRTTFKNIVDATFKKIIALSRRIVGF